MREEDGRTVKSAVAARAGFLDRPILVVLVASVLLVCVVFALIYLGYFS